MIASANADHALRGDFLDIGSGKGELLPVIRSQFSLVPLACDYTTSLMEDPRQKVDVVDLNAGKLPYGSNRFCLVTCIETIEHLEQTRPLLREIFRVLQPGGVAIISTPNILNLRSRLRYLLCGFFNLFGPLPIGKRHIHNPAGHINPVGYFYLAHALLESGFSSVRPFVDYYQRRSYFAYALFLVPIKIATAFFRQREGKKFRTIDEANRPLVAKINSRDLLLGRTLIVCAGKAE